MCIYNNYLETIAQNTQTLKGKTMPIIKIFQKSPLSRLSYYLVSLSQPESKICYVLSIFASDGRPRPAPVTGLWPTRIAFFLYDTFRQLTSQKCNLCSEFFFLLAAFEPGFLFTTRLTCALTITKYVAVRNMCAFCICFLLCAVCLSKVYGYVFHFLQ